MRYGSNNKIRCMIIQVLAQYLVTICKVPANGCGIS
jgi:hypothetical protein